MIGFDEAGRHCLGSQIHDSRRLTRYPGHLGTTAHGQDLVIPDGDGLGVGLPGVHGDNLLRAVNGDF
jgi:hypothetical protein